ncbi:aldehyde dehydrogenase family protein [Frankia gtarii]|uniref:aldehyde dehydrogenase family protein n=1 Tax=Frankia gtarii TaxID=2950102 RepID=UPI0021C1D3B9|nr:aldehyde dehydrogenase family protein [Frankia gtarii]
MLLLFEFDEPMLPYETPLGVGQGVVRREPYGVASIITPYNAPFFLAAFKLAPALAAGCTPVFMPSPCTPLSAFLVAEIAEEAGLPPGVFDVVTGTPAAAAARPACRRASSSNRPCSSGSRKRLRTRRRSLVR